MKESDVVTGAAGSEPKGEPETLREGEPGAVEASAAAGVKGSAALPSEPEVLRRLDEAYETLTKQNRRVCSFLRRNHLKARYLTTAEVAEEAGVSPATVVRAAEAMGFAGFADLQKKLREAADAGSRTEFLRVNAAGVGRGAGGGASVLSGVARLASEALAELAEENDGAALERAARILAGARRVLVTGHKASAGAAVHAAYVLSKVRPDVRFIETPHGFEGFSAADLGPEDALLVFTVIYYPRATLEIMRFAAARNVPIVLVSDFKTFDEAKLAREVILTPIRFFGFLDQTAPLLAAADALAYGIYAADEAAVKERLRGFNRFNEDLSAFSQVGRFTE